MKLKNINGQILSGSIITGSSGNLLIATGSSGVRLQLTYLNVSGSGIVELYEQDGAGTKTGIVRHALNGNLELTPGVYGHVCDSGNSIFLQTAAAISGYCTILKQ